MENNKEKMFTVKCSWKEFEHLQELFESGELDQMLGVEIVDMGITSTENSIKSIVLSQWLRGIIEPNWEVIAKLGDISDISFVNSTHNESKKQQNYSSIGCQKSCNLGIPIKGKYVEIILEIELIKNQGEINVNIRAKPCQNKSFLPRGLKLILLAESEILAEMKARSRDDVIQNQLTGDIGDNFSVKLALGDISLIEYFVI